MTTYTKISASEIPATARFDVPQRNQGQIVEVAYAAWPRASDEAGHGDAYKRVTDRSDGSVSYYRAAKPRWGRVASAAEVRAEAR